MDTTNIGIFLTKLRKQNNLTQADIAKMCNISAQAVSKWERGESIPDIEILEKLSILYKLPINEIINGEKQEVYTDTDFRKQIFSVVLSVFVFIAYVFPFAKSEYLINIPDYITVEGTMLFSGYELIFKGYSGLLIYLTTFVFFVLLFQIAMVTFLLTKVVQMNKTIYRIILITYMIILITSLYGTILGFYLFIPQGIILFCSSLYTYLLLGTAKENQIGDVQSYLMKKNKEEDVSHLIIDDNDYNRRSVTFFRVHYILSILIILFAIISIIIERNHSLGYNRYENAMLLANILFALFVNLILFLYVLLFMKLRNTAIALSLTMIIHLLYIGLLGYSFWELLNYRTFDQLYLSLFLTTLTILYLVFVIYKTYLFTKKEII